MISKAFFHKVNSMDWNKYRISLSKVSKVLTSDFRVKNKKMKNLVNYTIEEK